MAAGWLRRRRRSPGAASGRCYRGDAASAEADAAQADVGERRLMLDEAAKMALADYYAAVREEEVNRTHGHAIKAVPPDRQEQVRGQPGHGAGRASSRR